MTYSFALPRRIAALWVVLLLLLSAPVAWAQITGGAEPNDLFARALAAGDFDGDLYKDLAIGVPEEDIGFVQNMGVVNVVYGAPGGLTDTGDQYWHQDSPGLGDTAEADDNFGEALAVGDFDGDGYDDLAVGSPGESRNGNSSVGQVHVLYGGPSGLTGSGSFHFPQLTFAHQGKRFGASLAAGDFDNDGRDDLAVGIPGQKFGSTTQAGAIAVFFGSSTGIKIGGYQVWHQNSPGIFGVVETGDLFGWSLAAGDFDGDNRDDLAIGVILEDQGGVDNAGGVHVLYGSGSGLTATGDQFWYQDTAGIEGVAEDGDFFGYALAVGDFDNDGRDDLAASSPYESVGTLNAAGAVNVIYGSPSGLTATGNQIWTQDESGINGVAETGDLFGFALAAGDFDLDGRDDLAVGVPFEDLVGLDNVGQVNVIYGTSSVVGLSANGDQVWWQGASGISGGEEANDRFGYALATGDFGTSFAKALAVGVPFEHIGTTVDAGAAHAIYGASGSGLGSAGNQVFWQGVNLLVENPLAAKGSEPEVVLGEREATASLEGPDEEVPALDAEAAPEAASSALPEAVVLYAAYPNPVRDRATLGFALPEATVIRLTVYDLLGRTVAVLAEGRVEAGTHQAVFEAVSLPSGTYLVRLEAAGTIETQRLTLVR